MGRAAFFFCFVVVLALFCGCSEEARPPQDKPVATQSPAVIEVHLAGDPVISDPTDPKARNVFVAGSAKTWAEFSDYMKEQAAIAPIDCPTKDEDPRPYVATRIILRAGPDSPAMLVQYALVICVAHRFVNIFSGLIDDPSELRIISPESVYAHQESTQAEPNPKRFSMAIVCLGNRRAQGGTLWAVGSKRATTIEEAKDLLNLATTKAGADREIHVVVEPRDDIRFGPVFSAMRIAYDLGLARVMLAPPMNDMKHWPEAVRIAGESMMRSKNQ
ncbi:MAG: hypothetical protein WC712_10300 [Candidatus Brocadiia bacterium]